MSKRLVKVAKELNVGTKTVVEFLNGNGFSISNKPTVKITDEMYNMLAKNFQNSITIKEKATQITIGTRNTKEEEEKLLLSEKDPIAQKGSNKKIDNEENSDISKKYKRLIKEQQLRDLKKSQISKKNKKLKEDSQSKDKEKSQLELNFDKEAPQLKGLRILGKINIAPNKKKQKKSSPENINSKEDVTNNSSETPQNNRRKRTSVNKNNTNDNKISKSENKENVSDEKQPKKPKLKSKSNTPRKQEKKEHKSHSQIDIWKAYIDAIEIKTNKYSEPFDITFSSEDHEGNHIFIIDQSIIIDEAKRLIYKAFPDINKDQINIEKGYLSYNSDGIINKSAIQELKIYAQKNYISFSEKPCITGSISLRNSPFKKIEKKTNITLNKKGEGFATLKEIDSIKAIISNIKEFELGEEKAAILKFSPSESYANKQYSILCQYLNDIVRLKKESYLSDGIKKTVALKDIFLKLEILEDIKAKTAYSYCFHHIEIKVKEGALIEFNRTRFQKNIFFPEELELINNSKKCAILPELNEDKFLFRFPDNITLSELRFKVYSLLKRLSKYFGGIENLISTHHQILKIGSDKFGEHIYTLLPEEKFQVTTHTYIKTISFDFKKEDELKSTLTQLDKKRDIFYQYHKDDHKFKFYFKYLSPLLKIAAKLHAIPSINTNLVDGGTKLYFQCYFENAEMLPTIYSKVSSILEKIDQKVFKKSLSALDSEEFRYYLNFNKESFDDEIIPIINYLKGEELKNYDNYSREEEVIGVIERIDYPKIYIKPNPELTLSYYNLPYITAYGTLKGERDKIKRLKDTVDTIFYNKGNIVNPNLKGILIDSSIAKASNSDITETAQYKKLLHAVKENKLSSHINSQQLEAVTKSLLSQDFFIIQGPPGTGKSTAIAEIIWQHIRINREISTSSKKHLKKSSSLSTIPIRILVTSETNLAVDNALDKLRNSDHLLIKPIRFGNAKKLDREGKRFSLEILEKWVSPDKESQTPELDEPITTILDDWCDIISRRANKFTTPETKNIIEDWQNLLNSPPLGFRIQLFHNYTNYCNVVGATCSSIGKYTSDKVPTGKMPFFTRLFREYGKVFHPEISPEEPWELHPIPLKFDVVIQDEASKASPIELAIPNIYTKKGIVIGDHRQLPPMIDTSEFLNELDLLYQKSKSEAQCNKICKLKNYIQRNRAEFSISHFQKLFERINPNLKTTFNLQYRMHPAINETIKQFYIEEGGLECGLINPVDLGVDDTNLSNFASRYHGISIEGLFDKDKHVIWIDSHSPEISQGTSRYNQGEVEIIESLVNRISTSNGFEQFLSYWQKSELEEKQIGIITFYGAQASKLGIIEEKTDVPLRISPVDRFQGMERNIIIVSLVRSNCIASHPNQQPNFELYPELGYPDQKSLGFAEFPNRLNVALSRAKRLLIIVGNATHFSNKQIYFNVLNTIKNHPRCLLIDSKDLNKIFHE